MNEKFTEKILLLKTDLLNFLSNDLFLKDLDKAHQIFTPDEMISEAHKDNGFNDWIIHDYLFNDEHKLSELFEANHEIDYDIFDPFRQSKISYFTVMKVNEKVILKDIFDNSDYELGNDVLIDETAIIFARIYPYKGKYYFVDEMISFEAQYKEKFILGIMEKFNESREKFGYVSITEFVQSNTFLLYLYSNIIDEIYNVQDIEESFEMYNSVYAIVDREKVDQKISEEFLIHDLASEIGVYQLYDDEGLLGEILDLKDKIEFEFISREMLEKGKKLIETIFGEALVHLQDDVLSIDDLL